MDVAVGEDQTVALEELGRALAAFVDLRAPDVHRSALSGLDAEDAAAVEAHAVETDGIAASKLQHAAGADAGLLRVARGEADELEVLAVLKAQDVGVARDGGEGRGLRVVRLGPERQAADVVDHELRAVVALRPVPVLPADRAVIRGGREVEERAVEDDRAVGADGLEKLVHGRDRDLAAGPDLRRLLGADGRHGDIGVDVAQGHLVELGGLERLAADVDRVVAVVGHPGAEVVGLEAAAVHHRGVLVKEEHAGPDAVVVHVVGEEEGVFRVARVQQVLRGVVVDAAAVDREAVGVAAVKEHHGLALTRADAVAVDLAVLHAHIAALVDRDGVVAALVDAAGADEEIDAVQSPDADDAAAVEAAIVQRGPGAVFQTQYAARAEAGLSRVARGQAGEGQILTADEAQDVGIARLGGDHGLVLARAAQGEAVHAADDQLRAGPPLLAPDTVPGNVRAVGVFAVA